MKLLGVVILLTFLVATFGAPLVRDESEAQLSLDESENGIKDLPLADEPDYELTEVNSKISDWFKKAWEKVKAFFIKMGVDIKVFFDTLGVKIKEFFDKLIPDDFRKTFVAAMKRFGEKIKATFIALFDKYKDMIIDALTKDGKVIVSEAEKLLASVVEGLAKLIIDAIHKIAGPTMILNDDLEEFISVFIADADTPDNDIKDFWEKVKAMVKTYFVSRFNETKKIGPKYQKTAEDMLHKFEDGLIHESKTMGINFLGDLIKIIMGLDPTGSLELVNDDVDVDDNGFKEFWKMIADAIKKYFVGRFDEFKAMGPKYKTALIKDLKFILDGIWKNGRGMAIDFLGDLIKVIMGLDPTLVNDEEMDLMNVDSKISDWFKKVWQVINDFFDGAGHKIADFFADLGKKIKAAFEKVFSKETRDKIVRALQKAWGIVLAKLEETFNKYKDLIIGALIKDGTVILEEAEKLIASVVKGLADMVIKIIKKIIGESALLNDDVEGGENDFKELWEMIKAIVKNYFVSRANEFKKFTKYGPEFEKLLHLFETEVESQGKGILVDLLKDIIQIIVDGDLPEMFELFNDEETEVSAVDSKIGDWFKKAWLKVKAFFDKLGHQIKDFFDNLGIKIKVFFDDLGKKIKEKFEQLFPKELREKIVATLKKAWDAIYAKLKETFDKYKDLIIGALIKDGTVILEEAQKLVQALVAGIANTIIDWIKKLVGEGILLNDEPLESIADCVKAEQDCMKASTGMEKFKCIVDMATCVGGETAKCAEQCGIPLVTCVKSAIFGGQISDVPACFKTFVTCAAGCAQAA